MISTNPSRIAATATAVAAARALRSNSMSAIATPALLLAALAMAASACGGDANAKAPAEEADSPLEALFGWGDYDEVEGRRQELEMQQQMIICMKNEGFEYVAVDWSSQGPQQVEDEDSDLDWGSDEFGEKYGYGVIRSYETWEAAEIEANNSGESMEDAYFDPNSDIVQSMSESEQNAYYEALYGKQDEQYDEDGDYLQPPLEQQGCQGIAQLAAYGEDVWSTPGFSDAFDEATRAQESDPRMLNANADWLECMADPIATIDATEDRVDGMPLDGPNDMYQVFESIKSLAMGQDILPLDPETGEPIGDFDDAGGYSSYVNEDGSGYAMVGERNLISAARIDEIQALEVGTWKKDKECQEGIDFDTIRRDLEQQVADTLISQFPQLADTSDTSDTSDTADTSDVSEDGE